MSIVCTIIVQTLKTLRKSWPQIPQKKARTQSNVGVQLCSNVNEKLLKPHLIIWTQFLGSAPHGGINF